MQEVRSFRCGAYFLQVLERVVEDISFHAPERAGDTYTVDKEVSYVVFIWPLLHVLWYLSIFSSQSGLLKLLPTDVVSCDHALESWLQASIVCHVAGNAN
jgi:hypothetical protein